VLAPAQAAAAMADAVAELGEPDAVTSPSLAADSSELKTEV